MYTCCYCSWVTSPSQRTELRSQELKSLDLVSVYFSTHVDSLAGGSHAGKLAPLCKVKQRSLERRLIGLKDCTLTRHNLYPQYGVPKHVTACMHNLSLKGSEASKSLVHASLTCPRCKRKMTFNRGDILVSIVCLLVQNKVRLVVHRKSYLGKVISLETWPLQNHCSVVICMLSRPEKSACLPTPGHVFPFSQRSFSLSILRRNSSRA